MLYKMRRKNTQSWHSGRIKTGKIQPVPPNLCLLLGRVCESLSTQVLAAPWLHSCPPLFFFFFFPGWELSPQGDSDLWMGINCPWEVPASPGDGEKWRWLHSRSGGFWLSTGRTTLPALPAQIQTANGGFFSVSENQWRMSLDPYLTKHNLCTQSTLSAISALSTGQIGTDFDKYTVCLTVCHEFKGKIIPLFWYKHLPFFFMNIETPRKKNLLCMICIWKDQEKISSHCACNFYLHLSSVFKHLF